MNEIELKHKKILIFIHIKTKHWSTVTLSSYICIKQLSELQNQEIQSFLQLKVVEAIPKVIPNSL